MLRHFVILLFVVCQAGFAQTDSKEEAWEPVKLNNGDQRDYSKQNFKLDLKLLRAGAHDKSNLNDYYFTATLFGIVTSSEERKKSFADQQKLELPLGDFGAKQVNSLQYWYPNAAEGDTVEFHVSGDTLRELVADTMQAYKVKEDEVSVRMSIEMWEEDKKFFFFGEDVKIAETYFYPIPQTKFDTPARTNQTLEMTDNHGAVVKFAVIYEKPVNAAKSN